MTTVFAADAAQAKIARVRAGQSPRVLDLFAGCGGLSLGFATAGFSVTAAIEIDDEGIATHTRNLHSDATEAERALHSVARDVTAIDLATLAEELRLGADKSQIFEAIVGGPPCQAFARVGRAKLREVAEHPEAFLNDPRGNLYLRYLTFVTEAQPLALLMENVPDVINYGGHNIAHEVCEALEELGYVARYTLLNAAYYGVPQMRDRMFLVAYHESLDATPSFPSPTHWIDLPKGYEGTRQVALKHLAEDDFYYIEPVHPTADLPPAVTAEAALRDLPPITDHLTGRLRRGARRFTDLARYRSDVEPSPFGRLMREWPGFENDDGVFDHVIRFLPRDYAIFAEMKPGDQYPEAYAVAQRIFARRLRKVERELGYRLAEGSPPWRDLWEATVPPYDATKFPNKWRKMEATAPARTLMAHIGKDTYSHIHYDSAQARTISVREGARLQSFPDGFKFVGAMNSSFRQIGNAVPPLLAQQLAAEIRHTLTGT